MCDRECHCIVSTSTSRSYWPQKMNGRFFSGRRIEASLYAGRQRFRRSGQSSDVLGDNEETEKKRLDDFAQWLMAEGE